MTIDVSVLSIKVESSGIKQASDALGGLTTTAGNTEKRILSLAESMHKLQLSSANAFKVMNDSIEKLQRQASLVSVMTQNTTRAGTANGALNSALLAMNATLTNLNSTLTTTSTRTQQADRTQRRHTQGMNEAHAAARGLAGSLGALWVTYGNIAGMAAGLAIGSVLKGVVTIGKDVEHTLEGIRVKGMETVDSVNKLRESIYDLGSGVFGPQEVAKAFDTLIMAGLNARDAMTGMKDALNLALIGGTTIEKASFTLVQVSTALGYTAEGFSRVGDVIAKTAAVSMSSVESLSEAFKSGSVVGKLYKVSLVDIGTAFAALSNLGIKGSAAGTSLKNMYKELAADSDKLKNALNLIGLKPESLKKAEGGFKPLIEVFKELDKGLSKYKAAEQEVLLGRLANERGMKSLVEILSLYRTELSKSEQSATGFSRKLELINSQINESYGFMAQGSAAMALTIDSQFKSVANTLKVSLAKAFQEIQPQLSVVASSLKRAFASDEFANGVQGLAVGVANLTVFLIENSEAIWNLVKGLLALKVGMAVNSLIVGMGASLMALKVGLDAARASAIGLQAAFGLIGVVLAAAAIGMTLWATAKDKATNKAQAELDYMDDFTDKIKENTKQVEEQIRLMKLGKTATEAYTLSQQQLAIQKVKDSGATVVAKANDEWTETYFSMNKVERKAAMDYMEKGKMPNIHSYGYEGQVAAVNKIIEANLNLKRAQDSVNQRNREAEEAVRLNIAANKDLAIVTDDAAEKARRNAAAEGENLPAVKDAKAKAEASKRYTADILEQDGIIKASKVALENFEDQQSAAFKAREIGKITMIERIGKETIDQLAAQKVAISAQEKLANNTGNTVDVQRYADEKRAVNKALAVAELKTKEDVNVELAKYEADATRARIQELEIQGKFGEAAALKFSTDNKAAYDSLMKDIAVLGAKYPVLAKAAEEFAARQSAAIDAGYNKEAVNNFNIAAESAMNVLKGVQTATEGLGIEAMFNAATDASEEYTSRLDALRNKMGSITDPKALNEAEAMMDKLAEAQRKLWVGVGESIKDSLESAFGDAGKAAGNLMMVFVKQNETREKLTSAKDDAINASYARAKEMGESEATLTKRNGEITLRYAEFEKASRLKSYGDMAGAAKGFFKEGTTGYKVMEAAEKGFRLVELAGQAKSLATTIYTSAQKAIARIPEFLMAWGSLGPWGYAAGGVAIAAILGGAFGGQSGGSKPMQDNQGKGSVLGDKDATSESISKSLEVLERNSGLGLVHASSAANSLKTLVNSIGALASMIVRDSGLNGKLSSGSNGAVADAIRKSGSDPATMILDKLSNGLVMKISDKIANAIFGGKTTAIGNGFAIGSGTLADVQANGADARKYTEYKVDGGLFHRDKYKAEFESLGTEVDSQFTKVILSLGDSVKAAGEMLGIGGDEFNSRLNSFVVNVGTVDLKGLSGAEIQEKIQAVFSKLGDDMAQWGVAGLSDFQKIGEGYFETLSRVANDLIQVKDVFAVMGQTFNSTGINAVKTSQGLIDAAGGLDKLTEGTKYFVDNFFTEAERMEPISKSVTARLAELQVAELTSIDLYKAKVKALDLTNAEDQKLYAALIELAPAFKEVSEYATKTKDNLEIANKQHELDLRLLEVTGKEAEALAIRRQDEIDALYKLSPALAETQKQINAATDAMNADKKAKEQHNSILAIQAQLYEVLDDQAGKLSITEQQRAIALESMTPELAKWTKALWKAQDATAAETKSIEKIKDAKSVLTRAYEAESSALKTTIDRVKAFAQTLRGFREGLQLGAMSPLTPEQKYLESKRQYESILQAAMSGDEVAQGRLTEAATAFLEASRVVNATDSKYLADFDIVTKALLEAEKWATKEVDVAQKQLDALNEQVKGLIDIKDAVLTVNEAILELAKSGGLFNKQDTPEDNIERLYKLILGRESDVAGKQWWVAKVNEGVSYATIIDRFLNSEEYLSKVFQEKPLVSMQQEKQSANINVSTTSQSDDALLAEIKLLRDDNKKLADEVKGLREDQRAQIEAQIKAEYDAANRNATAVVEGQKEIAERSVWLNNVKEGSKIV